MCSFTSLNTRRSLVASTIAASGIALGQSTASKPEAGEEEVSPPEDLMREHGLLKLWQLRL